MSEILGHCRLQLHDVARLLTEGCEVGTMWEHKSVRGFMLRVPNARGWFTIVINRNAELLCGSSLTAVGSLLYRIEQGSSPLLGGAR